MTNYIIEGDIDFFAELNSAFETKNSDNICLLTGQPLTYNHVTLPCKHSFNYEPLYKEIYLQKTHKVATDTCILNVNQIKCPYCRDITNKILPYIPIDNYKRRIRGVNSPLTYCMSGKECQWIFKTGKKKGLRCSSCAYDDHLGAFCPLHRKKMYIKDTVTHQNTDNSMTYDALVQYKVVELRKMLKSKNLKVGGCKIDLINRLIQNHNSS